MIRNARDEPYLDQPSPLEAELVCQRKPIYVIRVLTFSRQFLEHLIAVVCQPDRILRLHWRDARQRIYQLIVAQEASLLFIICL